MDKLKYNGDPMAYQVAFMTAKRELDMAKVTMMDFTFCRLMASFEGKSKDIQFDIANFV